MAVQTTTTLDKLIPAVISPAVIQSAANARAFAPLITDVPFTGPGDTLDLVRIGTLTASGYAESAASEGATRTFSTDTATSITVTPGEIDVAMQFPDKALRRVMAPVLALYGAELGRAVAVKQDADVADNYGNFTGTSVSEGTSDATASWQGLISTIGEVRQAAKDMVGPIGVVCHTAHWADLLNDSESQNNIVSVDVRGTGNALFTGSISMAGGATVSFSTSINTSGSGGDYQNMVFTRRSITFVWKDRLNTEGWRDPDTKSFKLAAGADYAIGFRVTGEGSLYTVWAGV